MIENLENLIKTFGDIFSNWSTIIAVVTSLGTAGYYLYKYQIKSEFELLFENRLTKSFTHLAKKSSVFITYYVFTLAISAAFTWIIFSLQNNGGNEHAILYISISSLVILTISFPLAALYLIAPAIFVALKKGLSSFNKLKGIIDKLSLLKDNKFIDTSIGWIFTALLLSGGTSGGGLYFVEGNIVTVLTFDLMLSIVGYLIISSYSKKKTIQVKSHYIIKGIYESDIEKLELVHLYSLQENKWILTEVPYIKNHNILYLYEREENKYYKYTRINVEN